MTTARPIRPTRRAATLAIAALLALPGLASADGVAADADAVTVGPQSTIDLGVVAPSTVSTLIVDFSLVCANDSHVDPGQTVGLVFSGGFQPVGGEILSVSDGSVGPVPSDWPSDGALCPSPVPVLAGTTASTVQLRAPAVPGDDYEFFITWTRSLSPTGIGDSLAIRGAPALTVIMDVVSNTPPTLALPADMTVEGNAAGGWTAAFSATATDVEDAPDPTPTCDVAPGALLPLGTTTIHCSVTDSGGMTDAGSFAVTVVDTTGPSLTTPADQALNTGDPLGTTLAYEPPGAVDIVDADPTVVCTPAAGSAIPVGTTTVTCTATDDSGNSASASFHVAVTYVDPRVATAAWGEPVGADGGTFVANRGRTLPIKVTLAIDGVVQVKGDARIEIEPCGGGTALVLPLSFSGGRWNVALDTSDLTGSCHVVTAWIDDLEAGSFGLVLRGSEATRANARSRAR